MVPMMTTVVSFRSACTLAILQPTTHLCPRYLHEAETESDLKSNVSLRRFVQCTKQQRQRLSVSSVAQVEDCLFSINMLDLNGFNLSADAGISMTSFEWPCLDEMAEQIHFLSYLGITQTDQYHERKRSKIIGCFHNSEITSAGFVRFRSSSRQIIISYQKRSQQAKYCSLMFLLRTN